jgi:hypothetical protein
LHIDAPARVAVPAATISTPGVIIIVAIVASILPVVATVTRSIIVLLVLLVLLVPVLSGRDGRQGDGRAKADKECQGKAGNNGRHALLATPTVLMDVKEKGSKGFPAVGASNPGPTAMLPERKDRVGRLNDR